MTEDSKDILIEEIAQVKFSINGEVVYFEDKPEIIKNILEDDEYAFLYIKRAQEEGRLFENGLSTDTQIVQFSRCVVGKNTNEDSEEKTILAALQSDSKNDIVWGHKYKATKKDIEATYDLLKIRSRDDIVKLFENPKIIQLKIWEKIAAMLTDLAYDCTSRSDKKESNITFHRFPSEIERRKLWFKNMNTDKYPSKNARVCSLHFEEKWFYQADGGARKRLLNQAVPTLFPIMPVSFENEKELKDNFEEMEVKRKNFEISSESSSSKIELILNILNNTESLRNKVHKSKEKIKLYKRIIKNLQPTVRRCNKKLLSEQIDNQIGYNLGEDAPERCRQKYTNLRKTYYKYKQNIEEGKIDNTKQKPLFMHEMEKICGDKEFIQKKIRKGNVTNLEISIENDISDTENNGQPKIYTEIPKSSCENNVLNEHDYLVLSTSEQVSENESDNDDNISLDDNSVKEIIKTIKDVHEEQMNFQKILHGQLISAIRENTQQSKKLNGLLENFVKGITRKRKWEDDDE